MDNTLPLLPTPSALSVASNAAAVAKRPLSVYFATLVISLSGFVLSLFFLCTITRSAAPAFLTPKRRAQPTFAGPSSPETNATHPTPLSAPPNLPLPRPPSPNTPRPSRLPQRAKSSPEFALPQTTQPNPTAGANITSNPIPSQQPKPKRFITSPALPSLQFPSPKQVRSALEKPCKRFVTRRPTTADQLSSRNGRSQSREPFMRLPRSRSKRSNLSGFWSSSCDSLSAASPSCSEPEPDLYATDQALETEDERTPRPSAMLGMGGEGLGLPIPLVPAARGTGAVSTPPGGSEWEDNDATPRSSPVRRRSALQGSEAPSSAPRASLDAARLAEELGQKKGLFWLKRSRTIGTIPARPEPAKAAKPPGGSLLGSQSSRKLRKEREESKGVLRNSVSAASAVSGRTHRTTNSTGSTGSGSSSGGSARTAPPPYTSSPEGRPRAVPSTPGSHTPSPLSTPPLDSLGEAAFISSLEGTPTRRKPSPILAPQAGSEKAEKKQPSGLSMRRSSTFANRLSGIFSHGHGHSHPHSHSPSASSPNSSLKPPGLPSPGSVHGLPLSSRSSTSLRGFGRTPEKPNKLHKPLEKLERSQKEEQRSSGEHLRLSRHQKMEIIERQSFAGMFERRLPGAAGEREREGMGIGVGEGKSPRRWKLGSGLKS